jgi:hypothetical protein
VLEEHEKTKKQAEQESRKREQLSHELKRSMDE